MLRFQAAEDLMSATCIFPTERQCSVSCAIPELLQQVPQQVNGNAPFFKPFFGVFGKNERICSVFFSRFQADSRLKSGRFGPFRVGGNAPFSPLANGVSIENVAKMLGHSNIKMTQHYARVLDSSILRDMNNVKSLMSKAMR